MRRLLLVLVVLAAATVVGSAASLPVTAVPAGRWTIPYDGGRPTVPPPQACAPPAVTVTSILDDGATTTITLRLTGGGAPSRDCKDISHVAVAVCGNPELAGSTGGKGGGRTGGHVITTAQPAGWTYTPHRPQQLLKWDAPGSAGSGPWDLELSYQLDGTGLAATVVEAIVKRGPGAAVAGHLLLPQPAPCL